MNEKPTLEIIAPTVEEALAQGLAQLGLPAEAVSMEVLDAGSKGLFGLGGRQVRVRLTVKSDAGTCSPRPPLQNRTVSLPPLRAKKSQTRATKNLYRPLFQKITANRTS